MSGTGHVKEDQPFFIDRKTSKIVYGTSEAVAEHVKRNDFFIYPCRHCCRYFMNGSELDAHLAEKHPDLPDSEADQEDNKVERKRKASSETDEEIDNLTGQPPAASSSSSNENDDNQRDAAALLKDRNQNPATHMRMKLRKRRELKPGNRSASNLLTETKSPPVTEIRKKLRSPTPKNNVEFKKSNQSEKRKSGKSHPVTESVEVKRRGPKPGSGSVEFRLLRSHMTEYHHPSGNSHTCKPCNKQLYTKYGLKKHTEKHHLESSVSKLTCAYCGAKFDNKEMGRVHVRAKHRKGSFRCTICEKSTIAMLGLEAKEILYFPSDTKQDSTFSCNQCSRVYSSKKSLNRHKKLRHEQTLKTKVLKKSDSSNKKQTSAPSRIRFKCPNCETSFGGIDALKTHIQRLHSNLVRGRFQCPRCVKKFTRSQLLREHYRVHK